ncbi:FtsK/SpoIIIE domain-containing protein [Haloglycomyces albus]|uniref:FtsK/SpoIIIE domain-containing protein n=1 Tax=Haloglycomyces albus TaxID=526067 RepID=UPI00046D6902|nr:FtsK/SpoIIIE domain-containing protein [Haloglycomyces albus]
MPSLRAHLSHALGAFSVIPDRLKALDNLSNHRSVPVEPRLVEDEDRLAREAESIVERLKSDPHRLPVGTFRAHSGSSIPALIPFGSHGHLALDRDARDDGVAAVVRDVLLHVLDRSQPGDVRVLGVDIATLGSTFAPLTALREVGAIEQVGTDVASLGSILEAAERHVADRISGKRADRLILAVASTGEVPRTQLSRLEALARSGREHGVSIVAAGYPELPHSTRLECDGECLRVSNPPGEAWTTAEVHAVPVTPNPVPSTDYVRSEAQRLADRIKAAGLLTFADLIPPQPERLDPAQGLEVRIGRDMTGDVYLNFDDLTPHWLIGGRTGGGKTVFLLDVLYGLASHYRPSDLALFLLDFKEGVSFSEFIPTGHDDSYIPHARAVGVESDREYGLAVLSALSEEMVRRSQVMKRHGVSGFAGLRQYEAYPRIVCVADEFQVLLAGNDRVAQQAVALLETIARKGRSYGVHLVLASQTLAGIESLWAKKDSIFGQFPMRIALPGARTILEPDNTAAQGIGLGQVVVNTDGGVKGADRVVRFPNSDDERMKTLRQRLNEQYDDSRPPRVFYGYKPIHLSDTLPGERAGRRFPLGRHVDIGLSVAAPDITGAPGRNLALLGSDVKLGETLEAVVAAVAERQRIAVVDVTGRARVPGNVERWDGDRWREFIDDPHDDQLVAVFGADAVSWDRKQLAALRDLMRRGPERGIHLLGWWRVFRRYLDDVGGASGREDCAVNLVGNIPGSEIAGHFGQQFQHWAPREGRALLIDRHSDDHAGRLIVPFTRAEDDSVPQPPSQLEADDSERNPL